MSTPGNEAEGRVINKSNKSHFSKSKYNNNNKNNKHSNRRYGNEQEKQKSTNGGDKNEPKIENSEEANRRQQRANRFKEAPKRSDYGFVSRGEDNRLQKSSKERERYFQKIMNSFSLYCDDNDKFTLSTDLQKYMKHNNDNSPRGDNIVQDGKAHLSMDSILLSLRKLREAMINTTPNKFMVTVYLFSIRISALIGHYQTYIPSINHLLDPSVVPLLDKSEIQELVVLLILHLVHFNNQCTKALEIYFEYFDASLHQHQDLLRIIKSWVVKDYYTWTRIYNSETDHTKLAIMRYGIQPMVQNIIAAIEKSYFNLDMHYLNNSVLPNGIDFKVLVDKYQVTWELDGSNVVIKRRRVK